MEEKTIEEGIFKITIITNKRSTDPQWIEVFCENSALEFPIEKFGELEKLVKKTRNFFQEKYAKEALKKLFRIDDDCEVILDESVEKQFGID